MALNPAAANASFHDTFTITGGAGQAVLHFSFLVDAAFYSSEDVALGPYAFFDAAANGEAASYFLTSSERGPRDRSHAFFFGVAFDVRG